MRGGVRWDLRCSWYYIILMTNMVLLRDVALTMSTILMMNVIDGYWDTWEEWGNQSWVNHPRDTRDGWTISKIGWQGRNRGNRRLHSRIRWERGSCSKSGDGLTTVDEWVGVAHPKPIGSTRGSMLPEDLILR